MITSRLDDANSRIFSELRDCARVSSYLVPRVEVVQEGLVHWFLEVVVYEGLVPDNLGLCKITLFFLQRTKMGKGGSVKLLFDFKKEKNIVLKNC